MVRRVRLAVSVFCGLLAVALLVLWETNLWLRDAIWLWLIVLIVQALGAVPWLPWPSRFSLRTLLIATTLVASALGLVVWAGK